MTVGVSASALAVPPRAIGEWRALSAAIRDRGPAACAASPDPDVWWSTRSEPDARTVCADCPVRAECGAYAVAAGEREGVWGALGPEERGR